MYLLSNGTLYTETYKLIINEMLAYVQHWRISVRVSKDILSAASNPASKSTVDTAMLSILRRASEQFSTFSVVSDILWIVSSWIYQIIGSYEVQNFATLFYTRNNNVHDEKHKQLRLGIAIEID